MTKDGPRLLAQKEEIHRVLTALGWTVDQLADEVVLSRATLRKYAGGYQPASAHVMSLISDLAPRESHDTPTERANAVTTGGARGKLQRALRDAHLTAAQLAKKIDYQIGVVQAVVDGGARIREEMAERIENLHIGVTAEELLEGSETPKVIDPTGATGTVGAKPNLESIGAGRVRMIPLISMAEAGPNINFEDDIFQHEAVAVADVSDAKAFALRIHGNSMEPHINPGDKVVVCPGWKPSNGDEVICRTIDGDVMCKIYQTKFNGKFVILSSYNPAFPPRELAIEEIEWIYPVQSIIKTRRQK